MLGPIIIMHHEPMGIRTMIIQSYKPEVKVKKKEETNSTDVLKSRFDMLNTEKTRRSKEIT